MNATFEQIDEGWARYFASITHAKPARPMTDRVDAQVARSSRKSWRGVALTAVGVAALPLLAWAMPMFPAPRGQVAINQPQVTSGGSSCGSTSFLGGLFGDHSRGVSGCIAGSGVSGCVSSYSSSCAMGAFISDPVTPLLFLGGGIVLVCLAVYALWRTLFVFRPAAEGQKKGGSANFFIALLFFGLPVLLWLLSGGDTGAILAGLLIAGIVWLVFRGASDLSTVSGRDLLRVYLHVAWIVSLVILVFGAVDALQALLSHLLPQGVIYGLGQSCDASGNCVPAPNLADPHQDISLGAALFVSAAIFGGLHRMVIDNLESRQMRTDSAVARMDTIVGTLLFGAISLFAVPTGVYAAIQYLTAVPDPNSGATAAPMGGTPILALISLLLLVVFLQRALDFYRFRE